MRHRARADHPEVLARGGEDRRDRRRRRERDRLHAGCDGAVRPRPRQLEQVVDRRPQHALHRPLVERALREHRLPVAAALEVAVRRLLVAAHVRLEDRPLRLDRRMLQDVLHIQRVGVTRHHVRAARVARRERPQHVAHRPDDVRLHLAELRVARDPCIRPLVEPPPHLRDVSVEKAREPDRLVRVAANETGCARDAILHDPRAESTGFRGHTGSAIERRGKAAFGVRERHVDVAACPAGLRQTAERFLQLVLAELEHNRADDGDRNDGGSGQHLVRSGERRQVDRRHVPVETERLLSCADGVGIVLAGPASHVGSLVRDDLGDEDDDRGRALG